MVIRLSSEEGRKIVVCVKAYLSEYSKSSCNGGVIFFKIAT
jgi:hypothetical protein